MRLFAIGTALAGLMCLVPHASAQSGSQECKDVTVSEGGRPKRTTMCRGADGQWRPVAPAGSARAPVTGQPLAPNFRGKITYRGSYEGTSFRPVRRQRRLTVGGLLSSAIDGGDREQGTVTYSVEYDGNLVTGTWSSNNGRRNANGRFSGTRQGSQCKLFEEQTQAAYVVTCDAGVFRGKGSSGPSERQSWRTEFSAGSTETVDYVVRDRQRAEQDRQRAEQERQRDAERARAAEQERRRIAAMPLANAATTQKLDTAVRTDSGSWILNRYNPGTMRNVRIASGTATNGMLRGEYTYNGGATGTVEAQIQGGAITCLNYWDVGSCVAVRRASRGGGGSGVDRSGYTATGEPANYKYKLDVSTRSWVGVSSGRDTDGDRFFYAASGIQRSGGIVTLNTLFFNSAFDGRVYFDKSRIDCRARTITGIDEGVLNSEGSALYVVESDDGVESAPADSIMGGMVTQVCSGKALRALPNVLQAGFGFVQ